MKLAILRHSPAVFLMVAALCPPFQVQANRLPADTASATSIKAVLPATAEEVDRAIHRIETRLNEVRLKQPHLQNSATNRLATDTMEATSEELAEHDQALQQWVIALDQHARHLRTLQEVRRNNQSRTVEQENWHGGGMATVVAAEQWHDELAAQRLEQRTARMFLSILEGELVRGAARLEVSQKELRQVLDQPAPATSTTARRQWLIQLAQTRNQANEAALETAEMGRLTTWQMLDGQSKYIQFLEGKLASNRSQTRITTAELDRVLVQIKEKRAALNKELNDAIAADRTLRGQHETQSAPTDPHQAEVAKMRLDTSRRKVEAFHGFLQLADYAQTVWEDRLWASTPRSLRQLRERQQRHDQLAEGLQQWKGLMEQALATSSEQILRHTLRAEDPRLPAGERAAAAQIRQLLQERAWTELRAMGALVFTEDLAARLQTELSDHANRISLMGKAATILADLRAVGARIWATELYIAEDSVIAGGQKVSIPRSITLGKTLTALSIFVAGLLLARWVYRLASRWGVRRTGRPGDNEIPAKAFAMLLAVGSLLVAMASVRIPWTVFAFLGGALAIGVGFGAQALINNFISGIILLCERSIRVGDIVEVDEQRGKIVRVGFRNSLVARGDGIEVLVPNSQFLEEKVVNWTLTNDLVRYQVSVGVAYGAAPSQVTALMAQAAAENPHVMKTPAPEVLLEEFGDNAVVFALEFWMHLTPAVGGGRVRSELRHRIYELFNTAGIGIAFPQRDLHLETSRPLEIKLVNRAGGLAAAAHSLNGQSGLTSAATQNLHRPEHHAAWAR